AKAPDDAGEGMLDPIFSDERGPLDEIGDRIEAADSEPAVAVGDDLFGGRRLRFRRPSGEGRDNGDEHPARVGELSPAPRCGHSIADDAAIRLRFGRKANVSAYATG